MIGSRERQPEANSTASIAAPRIKFIDYAKGYGIFLVALGHVLRGLEDLGLEDSTLAGFVDAWVYSFHMPLFFFLSGLFVERSVDRSLPQLNRKVANTMVWPYFLWSILLRSIRGLAGIIDEPFVGIWKIVYEPEDIYWFLYVLTLATIGYVLLRKLGIQVSIVLALALILYTTQILPIELEPRSAIHLLRENALYLVLGSFTASRQDLSRLDGFKNPIVLLPASIIGLILIGVVVAQPDFAGTLFLEVFCAIVGIISSLGLAIYLGNVNGFRFVRGWGKLSLQIYVAHTIFGAATRIFLLKALKISDPGVHILMGTLISIYGAIGLFELSKRFKLSLLYTIPASPREKITAR